MLYPGSVVPLAMFVNSSALSAKNCIVSGWEMLQRRRLRCRARSNHFPCFNHTQAVVTATMFAELTYVKKIYQFTLLLLLLLLLSYAFQLSILGCASKEAQSPNFKPFAICHFNLSLDSMEPFSDPIKPFWNWTIRGAFKSNFWKNLGFRPNWGGGGLPIPNFYPIFPEQTWLW